MVSVARTWKKVKRSVTKPLGEWWERKRDSHLTILGMLTTLGFALMLWALIFFTTLAPNAQQEVNEWSSLTPITWVGVLFGMVLLIFVLPEFFHYLGVRNSLIDMLETDSRAELNSNKGECDEAVKLLAGRWPALLEAKRVELGIRREMPAGMELDDTPDGFFSSWMKTKRSRLVDRFPDSELLKEPSINRMIAFPALLGALLFLYNALFGLARETIDSPRNMTVDLTAIVSGDTYSATWAPHFDLVGMLIVLFFAVVLFMTTPAEASTSTDADSGDVEERATEEE